MLILNFLGGAHTDEAFTRPESNNAQNGAGKVPGHGGKDQFCQCKYNCKMSIKVLSPSLFRLKAFTLINVKYRIGEF